MDGCLLINVNKNGRSVRQNCQISEISGKFCQYMMKNQSMKKFSGNFNSRSIYAEGYIIQLLTSMR